MLFAFTITFKLRKTYANLRSFTNIVFKLVLHSRSSPLPQPHFRNVQKLCRNTKICWEEETIPKFPASFSAVKKAQISML